MDREHVGIKTEKERREERGRRGRNEGGEEAPLEAGLSNLSSSEPVQNLMFYLTNIAYFFLILISTDFPPPSLNHSTNQVIYRISDL